MTALAFPTSNRLPRTGFEASTLYQHIIHTEEVGTQEPFDYFSLPLRGISRISATALMCVSLGSGAMQGLTKDGLSEALSRNRANLLRHSSEREKQADSNAALEIRTIAERLRHIRKSFGLNASDMATLLGISRPTFYTWLEGQEPKTEATSRILRLSKMADDLANLGLHRPDNLIKRPMFEGGVSLFDLLQQGKDIRSHFETLRTLDEKEALNRGKVRGSGQPLRSFEEAAAESIPVYPN